MTLDEIRDKLLAALPLREPLFDPNERGGNKVKALEAYLLQTAYHRGELEEALHWLYEAQKTMKRQWEDMEGWEMMLPRGTTTAKRTQDMVRTAKRKVDPALYTSLTECKQLEDSILRQIRRLELDDRAASRGYTLITGS